MGNTLINTSRNAKKKDHPHIHGEYLLDKAEKEAGGGSPPHTWGILFLGSYSVSDARITPTYMGNTTDYMKEYMMHEDHPHIHGEYVRPSNLLTTVLGSPPHTWGIRLGIPFYILVPRITPTYMGNTESRFHHSIIKQDHPHIHGEHTTCHCLEW